jgi:very-short-patch-repair endonuclease
MARREQFRDKNAAVLRARELRRSPSPPESQLWAILRERPEGFKFRRQHPFPRCTVDFYCAATKLVIEIDGASHDMGDNPERDARRDAWLRGQGLTMLRLDAADVMKDPESALTAILLPVGADYPSTMLRMVPLPTRLWGGKLAIQPCKASFARDV